MDSRKSERYLSYFYPLIIVFGFVCSVTSAVAWNHWKYVLDTCVDRNCGCILNGVTTITYFTGGYVGYCHFATFGLFVSIAASIIFGSYHVWRICMSTNSNRRTSRQSIRQRSGEMIMMTTRSEIDDGDEILLSYWIPASFVSGFMVLYTLVHSIVYIDGAWQSCSQYRNELIKYMQSTGPLVTAVQGRISCSAVFDFMDYIFTGANDRIRIDRIDTSWCLNLAMLSSCASFILWCGVFFINVAQARRTQKLRT